MRGSICLVCKNQKLLVNGACVDACPEGTAQRGLGRFNLRCDPALAGPPLNFLGDDSSVVHSDLTRYHRPNLNLGRFENEISVRFRTHRSTGLVLSTWDDHEADYFAVELDEGRVRASWDLGTGRGTVVTPEDHYADGQWHSLRVTRIDSFVSLTLDDRPSVHSFAPGTAVTLDVSHLFRMGFAETALHPSVLSVRYLSTPPPPPSPPAHAQPITRAFSDPGGAMCVGCNRLPPPSPPPPPKKTTTNKHVHDWFLTLHLLPHCAIRSAA